MREGQFWEFPMDRLRPEYLADLLTFLEQYPHMASNQGQIPVDVSSVTSKLWTLMQIELEDSGGLWNLILLKDTNSSKEEIDNQPPNYKAMLILYVIPLLTCISLFFIKCCKKGSR